LPPRVDSKSPDLAPLRPTSARGAHTKDGDFHAIEFDPRPGLVCVLMPEAPVHKNDFPQTREYEIRFTWQVPAMKTKPVAQGVRQAPHCKLWLRIHGADAGHECRSLPGFECPMTPARSASPIPATGRATAKPNESYLAQKYQNGVRCDPL
jgi:hypothetical protein